MKRKNISALYSMRFAAITWCANVSCRNSYAFFKMLFLYKNAACKKVKCARKFLLLCFHYGSLEPWVSVGIEINQLPFSAIPMWLSFYLLYFGWMLNEMKWRKKAHTHFHCTVSFWLFELCAINSSLLIKLINHSSKLKRVSFLN